MKTRLTPHYIQLAYDACLKSFWRRGALAKFLRVCGVAENYLTTWSTDETKRDLLDRLFDELPRSDQGRLTILRLADSLIEQTSFPDLLNWEDSDVKLKQAHDAITRLRIHHSRQEEVIREEEDRRVAQRRFREQQQKVVASQQTLQRLSDRLTELGKQLGSQRAGYEFQEWFYDLADFSEVASKRPYVVNGRQIDGTVTVSGTTYLVELKFTSEQAQASDIDSLYKKVISKADNTMGIMASISGFSAIAKQEASGARSPLLLMDHAHIYLVLGGVMSLAEVINRVRRHSSQTGEAYLLADEFGL